MASVDAKSSTNRSCRQAVTRTDGFHLDTNSRAANESARADGCRGDDRGVGGSFTGARRRQPWSRRSGQAALRTLRCCVSWCPCRGQGRAQTQPRPALQPKQWPEIVLKLENASKTWNSHIRTSLCYSRLWTYFLDARCCDYCACRALLITPQCVDRHYASTFVAAAATMRRPSWRQSQHDCITTSCRRFIIYDYLIPDSTYNVWIGIIIVVDLC